MNEFKRIRRLTSTQDIKRLVQLIDTYGLKVVKIGKGGDYSSLNAYKLEGKHTNYADVIIFDLKERELHITTKYFDKGFKVTTYVLDLNLEEDTTLTGHRAFSILSKYYKIKRAEEYQCEDLEFFKLSSGKYACSASPIIDYNKAFDGQEIKDVYEYDLNSAYASVLVDKIPDLERPKFNGGFVRKGEVGFLLNEHLDLVDKEGIYADVRFPLIESPEGLKKFCKLYFDKKRNSTGLDKQEAKGMLNYPIGYMQRINPFLRSYIVNKCNKKIKALLNQDSICWNTDAIFSRVKRDDLLIGDNIGEFKEIKISSLRLKGNSYQTAEDDPTVRGVIKHYYERFKKRTGKTFNLLKDKLTDEDRRCIYSFNFNTLKLEENV